MPVTINGTATLLQAFDMPASLAFIVIYLVSVLLTHPAGEIIQTGCC